MSSNGEGNKEKDNEPEFRLLTGQMCSSASETSLESISLAKVTAQRGSVKKPEEIVTLADGSRMTLTEINSLVAFAKAVGGKPAITTPNMKPATKDPTPSDATPIATNVASKGTCEA